MELRTFHIKESDLEDFRAYAKKNVLFSTIKDTRSDSGIVSLVTNVDYVPLVNHYLEQRGYPAPAQGQEAEPPKKAAPRARPERSLPQRGNGSTAGKMSSDTMTAETTDDPAGRPRVKDRLDAYRAEAEKKPERPAPKRTRPSKSQTR